MRSGSKEHDRRRLLADAPALAAHIMRVLHERTDYASLFPERISVSPAASAVLLLLGQVSCGQERDPEPCLIFNKRSMQVKQAGDLCFPGGRIAPRWDIHLSRMLRFPFLALSRWPYWKGWRRTSPVAGRSLALLLAASLREGFEEMRLNPLRVRFLGPLPRQRLVMFDRVIYPMACFMGRQRRFFPNWEVEKIVYIPLRDLLNEKRYRCYRVRMGHREQGSSFTGGGQKTHPVIQEFPCFVHEREGQQEVLWGATYRITALFLKVIFGFAPPPLKTLPIIEGALTATYLTGTGKSKTGQP